MRELGGGGRDGDHEDEVEQQLELARRAVRFVDRARAHPDADPDPGAHRQHGFAPFTTRSVANKDRAAPAFVTGTEIPPRLSQRGGLPGLPW
ncbi:hypothetical protein GCM10022267_88120 [Lentzea roselyniae]|uniref:Uncharacterized protein n=1 Tax=Lentzea roselyniae TaxID=531940 RepID=A0ABP7CH13_9PSEU